MRTCHKCRGNLAPRSSTSLRSAPLGRGLGHFCARHGFAGSGVIPYVKLMAFVLLLATASLRCTRPHPSPATPPVTVDSISQIRSQLEGRHAQNPAAFQRWAPAAVMALRAPDFHTITPDGTVRDRAMMEQYTQGIMNSIKQWNAITFTIDSLRVAGDTAFAIVSQHLD